MPLAQEKNESQSLEQKLLERHVGILSDTLQFETLSMHDFSGSLLSPMGVYQAVMRNRLDYYVSESTRKVIAILSVEELKARRREIVSSIVEQLFVELAHAIGIRVPGPHVVLIDPRKHNNLSSMVETAQRMHRMFRTQGVPQDSIIISIPATEEGIRAAQLLEDEGILTNLYLVTSLMHAAACAEAKTAAISVSVGPLLAEYEKKHKIIWNDLTQHPGIDAIRCILKYFELNGIKTKVIGAAFRTMHEIAHLSECDAVCLSAKQADRLKWSKVPIATLGSPDDPRIELRARQAKYPTDLLTRRGGFSTWFSRDSRILTIKLLNGVLEKMKVQMDAIEHFVEQELDRQALWKAPEIWKTLDRKRNELDAGACYSWRFRGELCSGRQEKDTENRTTGDIAHQAQLALGSDIAEAMDEVF